MKSMIHKHKKNNVKIVSKRIKQNILKTFFLLSIFFRLLAAQAQAPQKMNYQAVIRNANNDLVSNTIIGMKISVLKTTATGTAVYEETQNPTTNSNGLAVIEIGNGTVVSGSFPNIDWANDLYFVKTETDPLGGTNYSISGTSQLTSVPYALSSADNKWAANANGINNISGNVGVGTNTPTSKLNVNGQVTIDQKNFGGYGGLLIKGDSPNNNYPNIAFSTYNSDEDVTTGLIGGIITSNGFNYETMDLTFQNKGIDGYLTEKMKITSDGNVGIGTSTPNAPLSFPPTLGKKITLYPGQTGDVGFGVAGNRLQIFTDNPNADVAIGYDAAGVFNEKLAVKANGAIAVNSNMGTAGQVLTSAGPDGQVVWSKPLKVQGGGWNLNSNETYISTTSNTNVQSSFVTIPAGQNAIILVSAKIQLIPGGCSGLGCQPKAEVTFYNGSSVIESTIINLDNLNGTQEYVISNYPLNVGPGTHSYGISVRKVNTQTTDFTVNVRNNTAIVIPQ